MRAMTIFTFQAVFLQAEVFQADSLQLHDCCHSTPCKTSVACFLPAKAGLLEVQAYQGYIEAVLTRVNTVNGRRYSEDPTVFSWELANEATGTVDTTGQAVRWCAVQCHAVPCRAVLCCAVLSHHVTSYAFRSVACTDTSVRASPAVLEALVQCAWLYITPH